MKSVYDHEKQKSLHSVSKKGEKFASELNLVDDNDTTEAVTEKAKKIKKKAKLQLQKNGRKKWAEKPLHGQYVKRIEAQNVSQPSTHQWLKSAGLKGET